MPVGWAGPGGWRALREGPHALHGMRLHSRGVLTGSSTAAATADGCHAPIQTRGTRAQPLLRVQVVNLHYMLSKTVVKARPSVLWCYKKDLYLSR